MAGNPAEPGYELYKVLATIADLQAAVKRLEQASTVYMEQATVIAFSGGAYCIVQYASGVQRTLPFQYGYTPVPGHGVVVLNYPWGPIKAICIPISAS